MTPATMPVPTLIDPELQELARRYSSYQRLTPELFTQFKKDLIRWLTVAQKKNPNNQLIPELISIVEKNDNPDSLMRELLAFQQELIRQLKQQIAENTAIKTGSLVKYAVAIVPILVGIANALVLAYMATQIVSAATQYPIIENIQAHTVGESPKDILTKQEYNIFTNELKDWRSRVDALAEAKRRAAVHFADSLPLEQRKALQILYPDFVTNYLVRTTPEERSSYLQRVTETINSYVNKPDETSKLVREIQNWRPIEEQMAGWYQSGGSSFSRFIADIFHTIYGSPFVQQPQVADVTSPAPSTDMKNAPETNIPNPQVSSTDTQSSTATG